MPLRALLFDFGGTLDSNGLAWLDRFEPLYRANGVRASRKALAKAFYAADDALSSRHRLAGLGLEETIRLQVRDVLVTVAPERLGAADAVAGAFVEESRRWLGRARPLLARWRGRYALGVVSNFYGNLDSILEGEGFGDLFDAVADSTIVGRLKPDPVLFERALSALGARPSEALMVGDSIERDMRGAERLGMEHAWLRGARRPHDACCLRAGILSSLEELESRLSGAEAAGAPR